MRPALRACLVLLLAAASGAPALAAPLRPASAPSGEVVAEVQLRIGAGSTFRAGGHAFPAAPGVALLRTDELVVPAGQVLVVKLRNGYLVRLDDDVSLSVGQIVLIDAPRTTESFGSQLDRLLTKEEQGRAERIAGVHARMGGALSSGIDEAPPPTAEPAPGGRSQGPPPSTRTIKKRPEPPAQGPPPAAVAPPAKSSLPPAQSTPSPAEATPPPATRVERPQKPIAEDLPTTGDTAPPRLPSEPALRACLAGVLGQLPVHVAAAPLRLWIVRGKIERAALGGGLRLPVCASRLLVGAALPGPEGRWLERPLPLE